MKTKAVQTKYTAPDIRQVINEYKRTGTAHEQVLNKSTGRYISYANLALRMIAKKQYHDLAKEIGSVPWYFLPNFHELEDRNIGKVTFEGISVRLGY